MKIIAQNGLGLWSAASRKGDSYVHSYPYKHIRDTCIRSDGVASSGSWYLKYLLEQRDSTS